MSKKQKKRTINELSESEIKEVKPTKFSKEVELTEPSEDLDFSDSEIPENFEKSDTKRAYRFEAGLKAKIIHNPDTDSTLIESINGIFETTDLAVVDLLAKLNYKAI